MSKPLIRALSFSEINDRIHELNEVLIDCVAGGASVGFMHPLTPEKATGFWQAIARDVENQDRVVLVAIDDNQQIVGTVQISFAQSENQPHRADVVKLLVHQRARRRGIAQLLMQQLDAVALTHGKNVLVLDTATGSSAEMLYQSIGWQRAGELPKYALMPDGALCSTTFYYKHL